MGVFKRVLKKNCETSSMKALPKIIKASNHFQHLLWTLALLAGLSIAGYQLIKLLMGYFNYATSVHIEERKGVPPFPDVTVCHQDLQWTIRNLQDAKTFDNYNAKIMNAMKNYSNDSMEYMYLSQQLYGFYGFLQNNPMFEERKEKLKTVFILDCYVSYDWDPYKCSAEYVDSHVFVDPFFGYCITYQVKAKEMMKGLSLVLYLDDQGESLKPQKFNLSDYTATHTTKIGARITIHPSGSFPDIFTASHTILAGLDVGFKLNAVQRSILDEPYGDCISEEEAEMLRNSGEPGYATTRHLYECNRMCAKEAILRECGCLHVYFPLTKYDRKDTKLCGELDDNNITATLSRIACAEDVTAKLNQDMTSNCPCTNPCKKFSYDYSTKAIEWPDDAFHLSFYENYIENTSLAAKFQVYQPLYKEWKLSNGTDAQKQVSKLDLIYKNFAQIRIENHQQEYLHYSETPLITIESLFGTVGGLLNLWAGITFITIIEILDFAHQLCFQMSEQPTSSTNGAKPTHV